MNESGDFQKMYLFGDDTNNAYTVREDTHLYHEAISTSIHQINFKLEGICEERIGDLAANSPREVQKTLQLVETLVSKIHKLEDSKTKMAADIRKLSNNEAQFDNWRDKLQQEKRNLENEKESLLHKLKTNESIYRQKQSKLQSDKEDLAKQLKQMQARERAIEAQFKKKETEIKRLQDGLKKYQQKHQFKNTFDVIQKFDHGANIYGMNSEHQYSRMSSACINETFTKLQGQNQYLKDCLSNISKELNSVLELKKETLRNKRGYDGEYDSYFELNCFKPETFNLPEQYSKERLKQLNENIQKFKQAIKIGDMSEGKIQQKKNACIGGIKKLITNYKQVVETQDQLLNKVLLKSKEFKSSEMAHLENRFSKVLDDNQINHAKKFVQDQEKYLQEKNSQLQKTKKLMQNVMKKAENNKKQMMKQRQDFQNQALEMRKSIEVIPAMIEEELSRREHH